MSPLWPTKGDLSAVMTRSDVQDGSQHFRPDTKDSSHLYRPDTKDGSQLYRSDTKDGSQLYSSDSAGQQTPSLASIYQVNKGRIRI